MSTRAMVVFQSSMNGVYHCYYRHCDGNPAELGTELINAIKSLETREFFAAVKEVAEKCKLQDEERHIEKPEDAFLKVQGDLEYVYVVCNIYELPTTAVNNEKFDTRSIGILKTSCPRELPDFVFPIWWSYAEFFPDNARERMAEVERAAGITLNGLEAYDRARKFTAVN